MEVKQYQVYMVSLDPTVGHECKKTRPCLILTPDEMNKYLQTVLIAPMTTKSHPYPTRIPIRFKGKDGYIILDQIRVVDKERLTKFLGNAPLHTHKLVRECIKEMLTE